VPVFPLAGPVGVFGGKISSGNGMKLAVTFFGLSVETLAGLDLPEKSPDQPLNLYPEAALAEMERP